MKQIAMCIGSAILILFTASISANTKQESADSIVNRCDNKYAGDDQKTLFSVSIKNKHGRVQNAVYQRFWKNQRHNNQISDKLSLFTLSPADARNTAFLQISFNPKQEKNAEQWLYLPNLRKVFQTTIRDLGDSFLGTDLTFDDIRLRKISEDNHRLINTNRSKQSTQYLIESRPKETSSLYSKKLVVYEQNKATNTCLKKQISYFDKHNGLVKKQVLSWQKVGNAWLWDTVVVKNAQTFGSTTFKVSHAEVNTGIQDKWFSVRMLKRGIR